MNIPDYISPVVGFRAWHWNGPELLSLNGELWLPGRPLAAACRVIAGRMNGGRAGAVRDAHEPPRFDCTCGVYAAKNIGHLRQFSYDGRGVQGEVFLWGTVVEHERGWRAQFAYPKSLFLAPDLLPFTLAEIDTRLRTLTAFGADIFILCDHERVRLWTNGSGYDAAGLDYLIRTRQEYYVRRQSEHSLKKGDRVAVLGLGIGVVELVDSKGVGLALGNRQILRVARKDIALNEQNMRWECHPITGGSAYASSNLRPSQYQRSEL